MKKSREMTKHFDEIYRRHNDPDFQEKEKKRIKREEENKNKEADLGLV